MIRRYFSNLFENEQERSLRGSVTHFMGPTKMLVIFGEEEQTSDKAILFKLV